jgi:hypothetical protein
MDLCDIEGKSESVCVTAISAYLVEQVQQRH